jgi:hypothetical protein
LIGDKILVDLEIGFEFPSYAFCVSADDQSHKLKCSGIEPDLYGNNVDLAMLGLPTLRVLMAYDIPILGGVHLSQRFRQINPIRLEEEIIVKGSITDINPHPRGCILSCKFTYRTSSGNLCVEAERSGIVPIGARKTSLGTPRPEECLDGFVEIEKRSSEPKKVAEFSSEAGNLIHSDPLVAIQHGFRAPISAGLIGIHLYREAIEKHCARPKYFDMEVWFRRPMFWDDTLSLVAKKEKGQIAAMHLLGPNGKPTSNCVIHAL